MIKRFFTVGLAWLLGIGVLLGMEGPFVRNFSPNQYGAGPQNWSVTQDEHGVIYLGNNLGLLEFDGANWEVHRLPDGQIARSVAADGRGRIYCGSYGEFGFWTRNVLGQLYYQSLSRALPQQELHKEEFWHILISRQGIFFQSFGILYRYDGQRVQRVPAYFLQMFIQEVGNRLLLPEINGPIYELDQEGRPRVLTGTEALKSELVTALLPHPQGIWIGTRNGGAYVYVDGALQPWSHPANALLQRAQLNKALVLRDGRLALGTILEGLVVASPAGEIQQLRKPNGLQNNTILAMLADRGGNLWLGLDRGVDLIGLNDPLVYYPDREGKLGTVYAAATFQGRLYVGTNQGLFARSWPLVPGENFQLIPGSQGQVLQLLVSRGQLLCGHNEGTFVLVAGERLRRISTVTGGWHLAAIPGHPDRLLQGTYTGLALFGYQAGTGWRFLKKIPGWGEPLKKLGVDAAGNWYAVNPNEGIYRFKLEVAAARIHLLDTINTRAGLPAPFDLDFFIEGKRVWIWSQGQRFEYLGRGRTCRPDPAGRPSPQLQRGLAGERFAYYPKKVDLTSAQGVKTTLYLNDPPVKPAVFSLDGANYLVNLGTGFALLLKDRTATPVQQQLQLRIKRLETPGSDRLPRRQNGIYHFPAGTKHLRFWVAHTAFDQVQQFRYRINPLQPQWSGWSKLAEREINNLGPGKYQLFIQSDLTGETATCTWVIAPHWYQTPWMALLYALAVIALAMVLLRWHQSRLALQRRRLLLEKERELHQQRIQNRNRELQADVLNKSRELASSTFHLIRKNEALLQMREELLKFKQETTDRAARRHYQRMLRLVDEHLGNEPDWQVFEDNFNQVHDAFFQKLKLAYPSLTPGDLRLAAYLRMNLSSKEIAPLLNVSLRGIENKRYRLRRKLGLAADANLTEFFITF